MEFDELCQSCNFPPNVGFSLQSPHHPGLRAVARNHLNRYAEGRRMPKGGPTPGSAIEQSRCHDILGQPID